MSAKEMTGRVRCLVPGCGRTFKRDGPKEYEIICGKHWRLADRRGRQLLSRVRRKGNRWGWSPRLCAQFDRLWQTLKAQAIERAMGI